MHFLSKIAEPCLELYSFQSKLIKQLYQEVKNGTNPVLLVSPTGSGKTVMMTQVMKDARSKDRRCVFIVHRDPLVEQTKKTLLSHGLEAGIIKGGYTPDLKHPIQIASIQTLARRRQIFPELFPSKTVVIFDEAHTTSFYKVGKELIEELQAECTIIGATATPWRTKRREGLADLYKSQVSAPLPKELMNMGLLVKGLYYSFPTPDLSSVRIEKGEYKTSDLSNACNNPELIERIVKEWHRLANGKSTIAFAVDVAHSRAIEKEFIKYDVPVEHIDADTPLAIRQKMYQGLRDKTNLVLCSVGVLTEGFDVPGIECVLLCRPTKSKALHFQQIGRGLRIAPKKQNCLILDQSGNCLRHGLPEDLEGYEMDEEKKSKEAPPLKTCPECNHLTYAMLKECPECGHEFEFEEKYSYSGELEIIPTGASFPKEEWEKLTEEELAICMEFRASVAMAYRKKYHPFWAVYNVRKSRKLNDDWRPANCWWLNAVWGEPKGEKDVKKSVTRHYNYLQQVKSRKSLPENFIQDYLTLEFGKELALWAMKGQTENHDQKVIELFSFKHGVI